MCGQIKRKHKKCINYALHAIAEFVKLQSRFFWCFSISLFFIGHKISVALGVISSP